MGQDIIDLKAFYDSDMGKVVRHLLEARLRALWPDLSAERLLGAGYATPYLDLFMEEAERVCAVTPAGQGVLPWPEGKAGLVTIADETELPFPDNSIDRVLLIHALESSDHASDMLREIWRILSVRGRVLIVVPNRRGIWSHSERTPFGYGQPFTPRQLTNLLRRQSFTPLRLERALFFLPIAARPWLKAAPTWEEIGRRFFGAFSGIVIVEAMKQLYGGEPVFAKKRRTRLGLAFPNAAKVHRIGLRSRLR